MWSRVAFLLLAASGVTACKASVGHADYIGLPLEMEDCCARAAKVCPKNDDWVACRNDLDECHRLGLWYEQGIKVERNAQRARAIFDSLCDRHEMGSCDKLCEQGDERRCVDLALLGIAGAGGRVFPPAFRALDRATFDKGCKRGDQVACLMAELDYAVGRQTVLRMVNACYDDLSRCFARACDEADPLGCALLCHVGDERACAELGMLALADKGFRRPAAALGAALLRQRCQQRDPLACVVLARAFYQGKGVGKDPDAAIEFLDQACPGMPAACTMLGRAYRDGATVKPDALQADKYLSTACRHGHRVACSDLAVMLLRGPDAELHRDRAFALLRDGCLEEGSDACRLLLVDGNVCPAGAPAESRGCVHVSDNSLLPDGMPPYVFERPARAQGGRPPPVRPPPRPVPHVGEGLFSGWKTVHNVEGGSLGVIPVLTRVAGPRHRSTDASGLLGFFTEIYMRSWYPGHDKYLHVALSGALGGGSAAVDGTVAHEATAGWRLPLSVFESNPYSGSPILAAATTQDQDAVQKAIFLQSPHALFVRGGYSLRYASLGPVLSSAIELPRVEAGYHLEGSGDGLRALELRANAGLVLAGRYNVAQDPHPLGGGVAWGTALVLHSRHAHVELAAQRIQAALQGDRPPVHRIDANTCLRVVPRNDRHASYLVCLQERLEHGQVGSGADASEVAAWQIGAFLGLDAMD